MQAAIGALFVVATLLLPSAAEPECSRLERMNLPSWFHRWLRSANQLAAYTPSCHINPFYLQGDFDGDSKADLALLVVERATNKKGIAVVHRASREVTVLGAGNLIGNGGDDFSWMDIWQVAPPPRDRRFLNAPPPAFVGEVLHLVKSESASGWIGWTGKKYVWFQGGD